MGRPPRQSLTSMLIEALTERIRSGQYKPGDQIPTEKDLIEEFNFSRTVVREAIANLKASGLVSTHQGKGAFVLEQAAMPSFRIADDKLALAEDLLEALEVRIAIEFGGRGARRPPPDARAARGNRGRLRRHGRGAGRGRRRLRSTSPSTARSPRPPATGISSGCSAISAKC